MINVSEALNDMRMKLNDTDVIAMTDEELITCLNEAIQYVASYLISANSPAMVNDLLIEDEITNLPGNFVKTAGTFPVRVTGDTIVLLGEPPLRFRYFATCQLVDANGVMPFSHDALNQVTIKLASIYAGNQLEADVSQDKALLDEINALIAQTVGGAK